MKKKKFKSEVESIAAKIYPHYADKKYTVIDHAKREIRNAQKIHPSYNRSATILVYERIEDDKWNLIDKVEVGVS